MWHRWFARFCGRFFFSAQTLRGAGRRPARGPVFWLALHRNGAVDGFAYAAALRRPLVFLISTQLRKSFLARIFFNGIAVARNAAEGDREANRAALAECVELLRRGGHLFVFPEGTSTLGPRHLAFKAGAAQIALDWLDRGGGALTVLPLGVHYDCPWAFRSRAEVVIGAPLDLTLPADAAQLGRLRELKRRMSDALEAVGANFPDATAQRDAEALATLGAFALGRSRFAILKACEQGRMESPLTAWRALDAAAAARGAWRYHGVPMLPAGSLLWSSIEVLVLAPLVGAGIVVSFLPWCAAAWAAKKFPDDTNVIALWKILVGLPVFAMWVVMIVLIGSLAGAWCTLAAYVALTWIAWAGYDRVKRQLIVAANGWRHSELRAPHAAAVAALSSIPDETDR